MNDRGIDGQPGYREFATARATQLFRIAFLICGNWHEAEDLTQTTLAKLFVSWGRVRRHDSIEAYARRVMMNAYLSQRRLKRSQEMPFAVVETGSAPSVDADLRMTLVAALRQLPPRSRAVVVLRYLEDHSIESVAEQLATTPAAVKSLGARGLTQLRDLLGADEQAIRQ